MNQNNIVAYTGMNDYVFKEIFQRKKFLVAYLHILGIDAKEEDILYENTEIKGEVKLKAVRFDIRIKSLKTRIDLEAQKAKITGKNKKGLWVSYEEYQNRRKIHYASMLHSEAYQEGEKYFEGPKTKVIFFLDYEIEGEDYIQHTQYMNLTTKRVYEDVDIIEVSLPKIKEDDTIEARMFKVLREKDLSRYIEEEGTIGEVAKMIYEFNDEEREKLQKRMEEDNRRELEDMLYFAENNGYFKGKEEGKEEGRIEGLEEGYLSGKEEGQLIERYQTAKNLLRLGVSIEIIMQATGLSQKEIENL